MLTNEGGEALRLIFDYFRWNYVENNPGCNGNDVERAFLNKILDQTPIRSLEKRNEIQNIIEGIR